MTPHEIVTILTAVERFPFLRWQKQVRYEGTTQIIENGWMSPGDQDFDNLLRCISANVPVRLFDIIDFPWPYPLEHRDGVPVWAQIVEYHEDTDTPISGVEPCWIFFPNRVHAIDWCLSVKNADLRVDSTVAADPRNPDVPPPEELR